MKKSEFRKLLKECITELLEDSPANTSVQGVEAPFYVEYVRPLRDETPFVLNNTKYEYCIGKYPNGKEDIAVYSYAGDLCIAYNAFRKQHNIQENEFDGKSFPKHNAKSSPEDDKMADTIAKKIWNDVVSVRFHSSSLNNKSKHYVVTKSTQPTQRVVYKDGSGQWHYNVGTGVTSSWETFNDKSTTNSVVRENDPGYDPELARRDYVYPVDFKSVSNYIKIISKPITGEYLVAWYKNGKFDDNLTYYTSTKKDSIDTFNHLKQQVDKANGTASTTQPAISEMSTTGGVAGYSGPNWVDPDPKRKKVKSIATKTTGGKLAQ